MSAFLPINSKEPSERDIPKSSAGEWKLLTGVTAASTIFYCMHFSAAPADWTQMGHIRAEKVCPHTLQVYMNHAYIEYPGLLCGNKTRRTSSQMRFHMVASVCRLI